jgi:Zn-dependent peptidase ImmA (M78 family)/transcriptional regulator with XRE-family HTH domain
MARVEATPTPAVLVWARETAGMSIEAASARAAVKPEQLSSWELGSARPTIPQLRTLARVYRRPLAAFYLPEPPKRFDVMHDFRRLSSDHSSAQRSPGLAFEIRRAHDRREWALELIEQLDDSPPSFSASAVVGEDVEAVAGRLRKALAVSIEAQSSWRSDNEAFKQWRYLLEKAGILTQQATNLELKEARGFSISMQVLPVVVVNIKDSPRGRIFTLLHEAAHLMLHEGGICDLHDADLEAFCNRVAGATLFPKDALLATPVVRRHRRDDPAWSDTELQEISRRFGGSREAALVRLLTLKLTTQAFYERMRREFLKEYQRLEQEKRDAEGFAPPHVIAISSAGPLFTALVVENFNRDNITASDVSDYLQIRLKHLRDLQGEYSR